MLNKKIISMALATFLLISNVALASSLEGKKIMLDSGHGGKDNGASGKTSDGQVYLEKNLNNELTQKIAKLLKDQGAEVVYTRDPNEDYFVELFDRPKIANEKKVDLFISIHHNAATQSAIGTEVFYSTDRPNITSTKYVEVNGNKYEYISEKEEDGTLYVYLLVDGEERKIEKSNAKIVSSTVPWQALESKTIAQMVVKNISDLGYVNRGAKDSKYVVTRYTSMPSILIEAGFLTNPDELANLVDQEKQQKVAQSIVDAIEKYYDNYEKNKVAVFGDNFKINITKRLAGENRYSTNLSLVNEGWKKADNVLLVYGENYSDALAAAALTKKLDAPIILTNGKKLSDEIKNKLSELGTKNVYIIGGQSVISKDIEDEIKAMNIGVNRISGKNRYQTSIEIAKNLSGAKEVFLVTGNNFADALSVATVAAIKQAPILYVDNNSYSDALNYVKSNGFEKVFVIGGQAVLSDTLVSKFKSAERIAGDTRYLTNAKIIERFESILNTEKVFISTGENYPDALSCSALSSKFNSPILLSGNSASKIEKFSNMLDNFNEVIVVGGQKALSDRVASKIFK